MSIRVVLNRAAVADLLRSPEVLADLERRARAIAAKAGPGHAVSMQTFAHRAHARIYTATAAARESEATRRTLTSALDAGRG